MVITAMVAVPCSAPAQAPRTLLGHWADDYGSRHVIADSLWTHEGANRYEILRWDSAGQFAIARNASTNRGQPGLFTRIDFLLLEGAAMAPYVWAFCLTVWDAPSADSAANVRTARRDTPRSGCGGFPFTRLRRE